jgi:hypothetical protein
MMEAELPDGTILEFPAGTSPEVIQRVVKQRLGSAPEEKSMLGALGAGLGQGVGNVALGAQNLVGMGLEKIGLDTAGQWLQNDATQGKAKLEQEASPYAEQYPMTTGGAKLGGEILATLPVGGALAKGVGTVAKGMGASTRAAPLVEALRTGGMSAGGLTGAAGVATRAAGGAATGGASAALVNPEDVGVGAAIGGGLPVLGAAIKATGPIASKVLGATTGAGEEPINQAFKAGKAGGEMAKALRENISGNANMFDILDDAKLNLNAMRQARGAEYRANMSAVKADKSILDLSKVEASLSDSFKNFTFKGKAKNPQVMKALEDVQVLVDDWKRLDPAEYHTPEGLDALKQQVSSYINQLPIEARDVRTALTSVEKSVKKQIEDQAPEYAKAMREYSEASDSINEVMRSLSQNDRATADTALRKLQSVMRNNANTNYGARLQSVAELEAAGGRPLMPALAGQALREWTPRGIQRATTAATGGSLALTGNIPAAVGMAALGSPRLAGEGAFLAGQAAGAVNPAIIQALRKSIYKSAPVAGTSQ